MSDFTHIVFTRINCDYPSSYPNHLLEAVARKQFSPEWLRDRVSHTKAFTAPSIRAQSSTNFHWVILMHSKTNSEVIAEFEEFVQGTKRFKVVTTDLPPREFLLGYIKANVKTSWVITTTLDSDDAFSDNYIEGVQQHFRPQREYLNVTGGWKYIPNGFTDRLFGVSSKANPYISLVEPTAEAKGVFCIVHGGACNEAPVRQISQKGVSWLQLIHGDNLMSRAKWRVRHHGRTIVDLKEIGINFSVEYDKAVFKSW